MSQPSDIPLFRGEETPEEAEKWLEIFIDCTGTFSDSGIFRLFFRKFPDGSPAREWFDSLEESSMASWRVFQQQFTARWITISRQWKDRLAWDAFRKHTLTDDVIFNEESADSESIESAIFGWVDEHLRLGSAATASARVLVETTKNLLPTFIRAYLQVHIISQLPNLEDICSNIRAIPRQILDFERVRRQMSAASQNPSMERKIEEVSGKIDKLIKAVSQRDGDARLLSNGGAMLGDQTGISNMSSNESVTWEACSPLTSVMSISDVTSELSTPVAQTTSLPNSSEDSAVGDVNAQVGGTVLYDVPQEWRKPVILRSRNDLIAIAQRAIDFITNYGITLSVLPCQGDTFGSALAIYSRLSDRHAYPKKWPLSHSGSDRNYDQIMQGITSLHRFQAFQDGVQLSYGAAHWNTITGANPSDSNLNFQVKPNQLSFYSSRIGRKINWHIGSSGEPSLVGGLFNIFQDSNWEKWFMISSIRTVLLMTLSSHLAECTGEEKYIETATLCAHCVRTWMVDPATSLVKDCLINAVTAEEDSGATLSCHLTGIAIEGFSVLATVTRDDTWRSLAIEIAIAAMKHSDWHNAEGVLNVCDDGDQSLTTNDKAFKGLLNRGLMFAYEHSRSNEPFCHLVRSYVNVQFDSLFSRSHVRNSYGIDWKGPYKGPYIHGQIAALDTIVAAIAVSR